MRNIKECLRLKFEGGLSHEKIARALQLSKGVVSKYVTAANETGLEWPVLAALDEVALAAALLPTAKVRQSTDNSPANPAGIDARATIGGSSFANSRGVVGVNQGAGSGNQQINAMRIASGLPQGLDDSALAQQSVRPSSISGAAEPQSGERIVSVDDSAFGSSRGVVQLNQSAGVGNRSINSLGIRITE